MIESAAVDTTKTEVFREHFPEIGKLCLPPLEQGQDFDESLFIMRNARIAGFGLAVATIMALLMFAPGDSDSIVDGASLFGIQEACAQTGTCKASPGDICFVNGAPYDNREWIGGSPD